MWDTNLNIKKTNPKSTPEIDFFNAGTKWRLNIFSHSPERKIWSPKSVYNFCFTAKTQKMKSF